MVPQLEKAKELVRDSIHAGIMSDLGSGNNIDICVITKQGVDYIRPFQESEYKDTRYISSGYRQMDGTEMQQTSLCQCVVISFRC